MLGINWYNPVLQDGNGGGHQPGKEQSCTVRTSPLIPQCNAAKGSGEEQIKN